MATGQYDNAWETPGWTVQTGYYPSDPTIAITPPTGLKNVTLTCQFFDDLARPANGTITVVPSIKAVKVGGATVILRPFQARLKNGQLENVMVLAPDSPNNCTPAAWDYAIRQRVGPTIDEYSLPVPVAGTTVDLYSLSNGAAPTVVSEFPLVRNFTVIAGADFHKEYIWNQPGGSNDLSLWTAHMQIRTSVGGTLLLDLTQASGITLTAAGEVIIDITNAQTAALSNGVYDLELTDPNGVVTRFLEGTITVDPNVTV